MFSIIIRSLRTTASKSSHAATKAQVARVHTVKLIELHDTLHATIEPPLQFHGLRLHTDTANPQFESFKAAAAIQEAKKYRQNKLDMSDTHPKKQGHVCGNICSMVSEYAQKQISMFREQSGRHPASAKKISEVIADSTTVAANATKETVDAVVLKVSNKVEDAQLKSNADLANPFDI